MGYPSETQNSDAWYASYQSEAGFPWFWLMITDQYYKLTSMCEVWSRGMACTRKWQMTLGVRGYFTQSKFGYSSISKAMIPLYTSLWIFLKICIHQNIITPFTSLHWRHNGRDGVSNHQPCDCLLNRLFRRRSKKTSKLRVTGLCALIASNAENVSIWWRHHELLTAGANSFQYGISRRPKYILNSNLAKACLPITSPIARFMGPTWGRGRQDPGGPHVGHMNFAI